jgi:hypothetical protein
MAPLIGKVSLAVAAMSYAGQFNITVIADRDTYPDLDIFVAGVQEELQALAAAMSAEPLGATSCRRGRGRGPVRLALTRVLVEAAQEIVEAYGKIYVAPWSGLAEPRVTVQGYGTVSRNSFLRSRVVV